MFIYFLQLIVFLLKLALEASKEHLETLGDSICWAQPGDTAEKDLLEKMQRRKCSIRPQPQRSN